MYLPHHLTGCALFLGGLLSAYALTGDELYKQKAEDLGDRIFPIFNTPMPLSFIDLATGQAYPDMDNGGHTSLAEAT